jgi:hypothetical protein
MPNQCRSRANCLSALTTVDNVVHNELRDAGKQNPQFWTEPPDEHKDNVRKFKKEVKDHYFHGQTRRCCYCSEQLQDHHGTFDAEHLLDRLDFPQFMFELSNLAAACKLCNGSKSIKSALTPGAPPPDAVPTTSEAYRIVHPHLDEWHEHLEFDALGRIRPRHQSSKGSTTIEVCGIGTLNQARLADHFQPDRRLAEKALRGFYRVKSSAWRKKYVSVLRELAEKYDLASAKAIVQDLVHEAVLADHDPA